MGSFLDHMLNAADALLRANAQEKRAREQVQAQPRKKRVKVGSFDVPRFNDQPEPARKASCCKVSR